MRDERGSIRRSQWRAGCRSVTACCAARPSSPAPRPSAADAVPARSATCGSRRHAARRRRSSCAVTDAVSRRRRVASRSPIGGKPATVDACTRPRSSRGRPCSSSTRAARWAASGMATVRPACAHFLAGVPKDVKVGRRLVRRRPPASTCKPTTDRAAVQPAVDGLRPRARPRSTPGSRTPSRRWAPRATAASSCSATVATPWPRSGRTGRRSRERDRRSGARAAKVRAEVVAFKQHPRATAPSSTQFASAGGGSVARREPQRRRAAPSPPPPRRWSRRSVLDIKRPAGCRGRPGRRRRRHAPAASRSRPARPSTWATALPGRSSTTTPPAARPRRPSGHAEPTQRAARPGSCPSVVVAGARPVRRRAGRVFMRRSSARAAGAGRRDRAVRARRAAPARGSASRPRPTRDQRAAASSMGDKVMEGRESTTKTMSPAWTAPTCRGAPVSGSCCGSSPWSSGAVGGFVLLGGRTSRSG